MNILHLCNKVPFPGRDGSSIAMESLINLEVLAGHTVHVVALNTNKHKVTKPTSSIASVNFDFFDVNLSPSLIYFLSIALIKGPISPRGFLIQKSPSL